MASGMELLLRLLLLSPSLLASASVAEEEALLLQGRSEACDLFVGFNEGLYERYNKSMFHVSKANRVFARDVLNEETGFSNVYLRLKHVEVLFGVCEEVDEGRSNCTKLRDDYLKHFDKSTDLTEYCLGYIFTDIDFANGTAGLAHISTLCRPTHNSGFITFVNHGSFRDLSTSALTFVHELGHNFGAGHDDDTEECKGKNFVMTDVYGEEEAASDNRDKFSDCSIKNITENILDKIEEGEIQRCFATEDAEFDRDFEPEVSLCGNGVLDPGEECDCAGPEPWECADRCCYPAHLTSAMRRGAADPELRPARPCRRPGPGDSLFDCGQHTAVVFGLILPAVAMTVAALALILVLRWDWKGEKRLFAHVTQGNIRIVRQGQRQQLQQQQQQQQQQSA